MRCASKGTSKNAHNTYAFLINLTARQKVAS